VWAERFDRDLRDIFDIQDEITETVCSTLAGRLQKIGTERARKKSTKNLTAYDFLLRGLDLHKSGDESDDASKRSVEMFSKAVELDPGFARAHAWLACSVSNLWPKDWNEGHLDDCLAMVQKALSLDPDESEAHRILGSIHWTRRQFEKADFHMTRALELNPNDAHILVKAAEYLCYAGRPKEGLGLVHKAMRLNPHHPTWYWRTMGIVLYLEGEYARAIDAFRKNSEPTLIDNVYSVASLVEMDEVDKANGEVSAMLAVRPDLSTAYFSNSHPYRCHKSKSTLDRFIDALRKTALPD
jgi:adenylate cyclase